MLPGDQDGVEVEPLPVDLASNAESLGARVIRCESHDDVADGFRKLKESDRTTVLYVRVDRYASVPGYESWWDVPVAEVSEMETVQAARSEWAEMRGRERTFL